MSLFHIFTTFGLIVVFGLVALSTAVAGFLTPGPMGIIWAAISGYMGLLTVLTAVTLYNHQTAQQTRHQ